MLRTGDGYRHRLLAEYVAAAPHRLDSHRLVEIVRGADVHGVEPLGVDHLKIVGVGAPAVDFGRFLGTGDVGIRKSRKLQTAVGGDRVRVVMVDSSAADYSDPQLSVLIVHNNALVCQIKIRRNRQR